MPRKKPSSVPSAAPRPRPYALTIAFDREMVRLIERLEKETRLGRTHLIRFLIAEEAKRRGLRPS